MTLHASSIEWAIDFVADHSDGDLFPKVPEMEAIRARRGEFVSLLEGKQLSSFKPGPSRRFIVPKDEISYRQATQLDPQDSLILSALIHQFGAGIERRRKSSRHVHSYRFSPTVEGGLYGADSAWNDFWCQAHESSKAHPIILYCDIADFYNQVYHHDVENQLIESGFPNQAVKWLISLLESTTAGVSRGVPVGPHGIHLIAEASLIPIDDSISHNGLNCIRYADDIVVFCDTMKEAKLALATIAGVLDKQQRLMLQKHKTRFYEAPKFQALCRTMIEDRPISPDEAGLLKLIKKYSGGNRYKTILYSQISKKDWESISENTIRGIIEDYISAEPIDFIRLRWFYRRLTQIGHPGAVHVSLHCLDQLAPCFANICLYLASVQSIEPKQWEDIGTRLIKLLDSEEVKSNEYFSLSILSLFSKNKKINHFASLAGSFQSSPSFVRREIFLAAMTNSAYPWIREHKESFINMDPWQKMAFIYCCSGLPRDEKKYFINRWEFDRPFEKVLAKWSRAEGSS
ncbi:hypothetical protein PDESU_04911 [Pontiella desulfatans]|uniref:Reverse transcriptase domain-containing protein n=1 Tax=Pontiella desulfatans TaxID=2750659 RepID=A0A6C2U8D9_PONDE|nr:RNA-directed DNA polymerase [Pontiella desulfatans]VGO16320.1 hypothetical protein PDESU_04911 [Pontiella desulfatans]